MIPHVSQGIKDLSQKVLTQVLPNLSSSYAMSDTAMMAMLMNALADEAESGVAKRLTDIAEMAELLSQAKASVNVPSVISNPTELTLTAVSQVHDVCTRALIEVHAQVEADDPNGELNRQIWVYLAKTHERHALSI